MSHDKIGPKEMQRRQLREERFEQKGGKKPSISELRKTIAKPVKRKQGAKR